MTDPADLKCPECGHAIPPTGMSSQLGTGTGGDDIPWQPERQHTECPECQTKLVRNVEPPGDQWQRAEPEQED